MSPSAQLPGSRSGVAPQRVVSLLPAATEIVYALGLDDRLVAVTFECDEPVAARRDKAVLVDGRDTAGLTPAEIDAYVRERTAAGADLYRLDAEALAGLDPDLVLTQDLCRVCALPSATVDQALAHRSDSGCSADVLALDPTSLADVLASIQAVADRAGAPERGHELVAGLRRRLATVTGAVAGRARPRVALLEWVDPPFTAGHWIPDLVVAAGGDPVVATPGRRSAPTTWHEIAAAEPDVAVVGPCGFHLDAAAEQAVTVAARLPGVPVWAIDGDGLIVRPGPRVIDGVEALASILHPGAVPIDPVRVRALGDPRKGVR